MSNMHRVRVSLLYLLLEMRWDLDESNWRKKFYDVNMVMTKNNGRIEAWSSYKSANMHIKYSAISSYKEH